MLLDTKDDANVQNRFEAALASFVERVKADRYIIAAILFGSLSYDRVWEKSDIDLMLVSADKSTVSGTGGSERAFALVENEVNIHAILQTRSQFKKMIEGSLQSSFMHSSFVRSRLLFTRDETIRELYANIDHLGARDQQKQLFHAAASVLPQVYKAEKFLRVKADPQYSFIWVTYAYDGLAQIEVFLNHQIAGRDVMHQALSLNPEFFKAIYTDLLDRKKTAKNLEIVLRLIDDYLTEKIPLLFAPLLDYLASAGSFRSATEIEYWLANQMGIQGAITACEWLADKGVIAKVSTPVRLTTKSQTEFEELAFYYQKD